MRYSKILFNLLLLLLIPSLIVYPQVEIPAVTQIRTEDDLEARVQAQGDQLFSYDDVLDLIEELEEGDLEKRCSLEELEKINKFIALLAERGILPNEFDEQQTLENDVHELLHEDSYAFSIDDADDYFIIPAVHYGSSIAPILCKSWVEKKWKQTKKFVKKHKKAILIGAAVVAAVVIVVCVVSAAATASAAAAGAAAASGSSEEKSSVKEESDNITSVTSDEAPLLKSVIEEQISTFKETVLLNYGQKNMLMLIHLG